ncbi:MAG: AI-2E family transporter [Kordiimonadaceae bacterium]|nr:AI-2E family transporter [Kordiimonadaceae bacterium]
MNLVSDWFRKTFADTQVVLLMLVMLVTIVLATFFARMLAPAIAATVIAFLLDGPVTWLIKRGARPLIALTSVYLGFVMISLITVLAIIPPLALQVAQFIQDAPAMIGSLQKALLSLQTSFPEIISEAQVQSGFATLGSEMANIGPKLLQYSLTGVTGAISYVVYMVLVPVMVFFFLKDKEIILSWIGSFLPKDKSLVEEVWAEIIERAGDYARGKVYEILVVGIIAFFTYQFLELRYATLLAVATGFSVLIPYFGAAVVTLPVALVAYFQWGLSGDTASVIIAYLIIQALDGNLLAPLLFSEVVHLHPNAIIIAILVCGGLWGLWGVFFAIPLATVANAIIKAWRQRAAHNSSHIAS